MPRVAWRVSVNAPLDQFVMNQCIGKESQFKRYCDDMIWCYEAGSYVSLQQLVLCDNNVIS